jgi:hypothetical protein
MTIQVIQWMACCLPFPATVVSGCLWLEPGPDDFRDLFHRTIPEDLWYSYSEWWGYKYVNQPEGGRNLSKSCSDKPEKKQLEFTNPNRSLKSHPSLSQELCQGLRAQEATSHRPWDALRSRWEWRDFFFQWWLPSCQMSWNWNTCDSCRATISRAFSGFHLMPWLATRWYKILQTHKVSGKSAGKLDTNECGLLLTLCVSLYHTWLCKTAHTKVHSEGPTRSHFLIFPGSCDCSEIQVKRFKDDKRPRSNGQPKAGENLGIRNRSDRYIKILKPLGQRQVKFQHVQTMSEPTPSRPPSRKWVQIKSNALPVTLEIRFLSFALDICLTG